jgi:hypothetical protein
MNSIKGITSFLQKNANGHNYIILARLLFYYFTLELAGYLSGFSVTNNHTNPLN